MYFRIEASDLPRETAKAALKRLVQARPVDVAPAVTGVNTSGAYYVGIESPLLCEDFRKALAQLHVTAQESAQLPGGQKLVRQPAFQSLDDADPVTRRHLEELRTTGRTMF